MSLRYKLESGDSMDQFKVVYKVYTKGDKSKETIGYIMKSNTQVIAIDLYKGLEFAGKGFVDGGKVGRINNKHVIVKVGDPNKEIGGRRITEEHAKAIIKIIQKISGA